VAIGGASTGSREGPTQNDQSSDNTGRAGCSRLPRGKMVTSESSKTNKDKISHRKNDERRSHQWVPQGEKRTDLCTFVLEMRKWGVTLWGTQRTRKANLLGKQTIDPGVEDTPAPEQLINNKNIDPLTTPDQIPVIYARKRSRLLLGRFLVAENREETTERKKHYYRENGIIRK